MQIKNYLTYFVLACACGCAPYSPKIEGNRAAKEAFMQRCATSGEFIHETVENVDSVSLMKVRGKHKNFHDQFILDDPYGSDVSGDGYIETFLKQSYDLLLLDKFARLNAMQVHRPTGYAFVEAVDINDGIRYRYTARLEEPWQVNKDFLEGYYRIVLEKEKNDAPAPRYGVTYDDISTIEDRKLWIAGSSLKIIDLHKIK